MKHPIKFILINYSNFKAILQLEIVPILDILEIKYSFYMLNFLTDSIVDSFRSNPSNTAMFETLNKELKTKTSFGLILAEEFVLSLKNIINSNNSQSQEYLKVIFPKDQLILYLNYTQIYSILTFTEQYVINYEMMKLYLLKESNQEQSIITSPEVVNLNPPQLNLNQDNIIDQGEEANIEIEDVGTDLIVLVNDSIKLSPNNICTYYLSKYITKSLSFIQAEEPIEFSNNSAIIKISPLIDLRVLGTSTSHFKDLTTLLDSFNFIRDEYLSKIKLLVQNLNYITNFYQVNATIDKVKAKETTILALKITYFLIFIYTLKLGNMALINNLTNKYIDNLVNQAIDYMMTKVLDSSKIKFEHMIFNSIDISSDTEKYQIVTDQLDQILTKEKHMIQIDRESFIKSVFNQAKLIDKASKSKNIKLKLNTPNIINIEDFINKTPEINTNLSYTLIDSKISQFSTRKFLTKEYLDLLVLSITPKMSISTVDLSLIHPIISKHYDNILNNIFREINSKQLEEPVSLLYLLDYFIKPFISDISSVNTDLFLLFRIIIPYLYDNYGIKNYIDYFH